MSTYTVTVTFTFDISAEDEEQAGDFADSAFEHIIKNPQTGDFVTPDIDVKEN